MKRTLLVVCVLALCGTPLLAESDKMVFGGVGILIAGNPIIPGTNGENVVTDVVRVMSVVGDSPACKADVKAGNLITHIDSKSVSGHTLGELVGWFRGAVGSEISLTISRKGCAEPLKLKLVRQEINLRDHPTSPRCNERFAMPILPACATLASAQVTNTALERAVYSFLVQDSGAPKSGITDTNRNVFTLSIVAQNPAKQDDIKAKFGIPSAVETNVGCVAWVKSAAAPTNYYGDVWFYGRIGILIEDDKAVAVIRRSVVTGISREDATKFMAEAMSIGLSPDEQAKVQQRFSK